MGSLQCSILWFLGIKKFFETVLANAKKGGDIHFTVAVQSRCGRGKKGRFDLIMTWHDGMSLARCKSSPAANFLLLWSARTGGNKCSWHKACIVFLPIRSTKKRSVQ